MRLGHHPGHVYRSGIVQRTVEDAVNLASAYAGQSFDDWAQVVAARDRFSGRERRDLVEAKAAKAIYNASNDIVPYKPLTDSQSQDLATKKGLLAHHVADSTHRRVLEYLEGKVEEVFGKTGLNEFYRGAHIVFDDHLTVYQETFDLAISIAAKAPGQNVVTPEDVMTKSAAAGTTQAAVKEYSKSFLRQRQQIGALTNPQLEEGKMMKRRPEAGETSHYQNPATAPLAPQLGIDFPTPVNGHILFGVVPGTTNSFVQTEGAGFQNLVEHIRKHGAGAFWNMAPLVGGWQTGLIGHSRASEKPHSNSHLRQADNQWSRRDLNRATLRKETLTRELNEVRDIDADVVNRYDRALKLRLQIQSRNLASDAEYNRLKSAVDLALVVVERALTLEELWYDVTALAGRLGPEQADAVLRRTGLEERIQQVEVLANKVRFISTHVELVNLLETLPRLIEERADLDGVAVEGRILAGI